MNIPGSRPLLISALVYGIISILCTQLPLLNYLGYEFAILVAVVSSIVAGLTSIGATRNVLSRVDTSPAKRRSPALDNLLHIVLANLTLLIIPVVVMLTNMFFVKNCSLLEGIGYFILLPVVSVLFSSALGFFCAIHYGFAKTIFFTFFVATFLYSALVGYFTPAIFSYNFFYGYFPGLTYDEALGIQFPLIFYRLFTLIIAGAFVWMGTLVLSNTLPGEPVRKKGIHLLKAMTKPPHMLFTIALVLVCVLSFVYKGELGFESHGAFIRETLGESYETTHFVLYYSRESYDDEEIRWTAAEHEFRLQQVLGVFNISFNQKIESYIYPTNEVKQRLIGTGTTNIAKPWSRQIHISKQSLHETLKHELVHVVAAPFGLPVIDASLSTGLVEGLGMAIEWDWGNRTLHQYAAGMRKFGVSPDIGSLMRFTGFAAQASSISYVLAGSFCRYLIDRYGIRKMVHLYRSNDYESIYGRSLEELIAEWSGFLTRIPVPEEERDAIDVLFRRPPIFQKVCARVIAARNIEARKEFASNNFDEAARLYEESYREGKGYDAFSGFLSSKLYARDFSTLTLVLDTVILRDERPSQYLPLFLNIGMAFWAEGNLLNARQLFERVAFADLSEGLTEAAYARLAALSDSTNREALLRYFLTPASDTVRIAMLDSMVQNSDQRWLPVYLKGKALVRLQRWGEGRSVLETPDASVRNAHLESIRLKTIGAALFRLHRFQEAKVAFWNSLNFVSSEVARNEVNDWVDRCEWMEKAHIFER